MSKHRPLFVQIAEQIEDDILSGKFPEGTQVPSTNDYATSHQVNPATVGKGMRLLATEGYLEKRRGVGTFVGAGSKQKLAAARRERFSHGFVGPLVGEALQLGISVEELTTMVVAEAALREKQP